MSLTHENDIKAKEKMTDEAAESINKDSVTETPLADNSGDAEKESEKIDSNLKELISKKEDENKELLDRMQRLAAEYDNFRKRTQKEKEKIYSDALADVVSNFLPVVDNLERAIKAAEAEEGQGMKEGVTLIFRQFSDILGKLGVKPIEAVGAAFNPELHNAVMHVEDESLDQNSVVEEFQKGYIYKDEIVIRHSMVKVAN